MHGRDPTIEYYESDYPSKLFSKYPENFDATTEFQGIMYDVERYCEFAGKKRMEVLELCCGAGRVGLPIAMAGHDFVGVDYSRQMLQKFEILARNTGTSDKVCLVTQDVTELNLVKKTFDICLIAFNSLLLVGDFERQQSVLKRAAKHLKKGGRIIIDVINPMLATSESSTIPAPFCNRRHPVNGNRYTRFAARSAVDQFQTQTLFGWYDEIQENGFLRRQSYDFKWRLIYRYELELMLRIAKFQLLTIDGGHRREIFTEKSPRMLVQAIRI